MRTVPGSYLLALLSITFDDLKRLFKVIQGQIINQKVHVYNSCNMTLPHLKVDIRELSGKGKGELQKGELHIRTFQVL